MEYLFVEKKGIQNRSKMIPIGRHVHVRVPYALTNYLTSTNDHLVLLNSLPRVINLQKYIYIIWIIH